MPALRGVAERIKGSWKTGTAAVPQEGRGEGIPAAGGQKERVEGRTASSTAAAAAAAAARVTQTRAEAHRVKWEGESNRTGT